MTARKTTQTSEAGPGFEEALSRLETIVGDMENGALTLDDMIRRFEEGQSLVRLCTTKLNEIEKKVELLVRKGDAVTTEPFDADTGGGPSSDEPPAAPNELF